MNEFSAGSCISFGWETFKKRSWFFIGSYLLFFIVIGIITAALNELTKDGGIMEIIAVLARVVFEMLIGMGSIAFALKAHDDVAHVRIADFWRPSPFWKYTGATLLFGLVFLVGLVLVIIPGIIWGVMFGLSGYFVIDKGMWPIEALKESKRITYGYKWELFLLGLLSALITIIGIVCFLVGILVAYPIAAVALAHAYRVLSQKATAPAPAA